MFVCSIINHYPLTTNRRKANASRMMKLLINWVWVTQTDSYLSSTRGIEVAEFKHDVEQRLKDNRDILFHLKFATTFKKETRPKLWT